MKLYEIEAEIAKIVDDYFSIVALDDPGSQHSTEGLMEISAANEIKEKFEALQYAKETKLENIARLIKNSQARQAAIAIERARLKREAEKEQSLQDNLEAYVLFVLGPSKADAGLFKFSWLKSERVCFSDMEEIPRDFIKEKVTYDVDKAAIKKSFKAGVPVVGAWIEEHQNLQIK